MAKTLGLLLVLTCIFICTYCSEDSDTEEITTAFGEDDIIIDVNNMIDDFEDGDIQVMQIQGRTGIWHLDNDGSGVQTPAGGFKTLKGGPGNSSNYAHTTGRSFTVWGAELNVNLNTPDYPGIEEINYMPYDASLFNGVVFMARGKCSFRLNLTIIPIVPTNYGGTCDENVQDCFDSHGKMFTINHPYEWRQYRMAFSEVKQSDWGLQADFNPAGIMALQFHFDTNTNFDLAVDNIAFYVNTD